MAWDIKERGVQSPEYAEVNVTVECADGSKEEELQAAPGLTMLPIYLQTEHPVCCDHALH